MVSGFLRMAVNRQWHGANPDSREVRGVGKSKARKPEGQIVSGCGGARPCTAPALEIGTKGFPLCPMNGTLTGDPQEGTVSSGVGSAKTSGSMIPPRAWVSSETSEIALSWDDSSFLVNRWTDARAFRPIKATIAMIHGIREMRIDLGSEWDIGRGRGSTLRPESPVVK